MMNANLENEKISKQLPLFCLMLFSFFLIYFIPQIGITDFRWNKESLYTAISIEMNFSHPVTVAHGELISETYPLFPMLVALLIKLMVPVSSAARIISVIFILATTIAIWVTAKRAFNIQAAFVSSSVFFSSVIIVDKGMEGLPETLAFFWLFLAWGTWFTLGIQRSLWNAAWLLSFTFCGLSFYTIGWEALFYFFLPLIFLRRPLSIWSRLNKFGFYTGISVLAFFVIIWSYPRWIEGQDIPFRNIANEFSSGYLRQILFFPFDFFLRTSPWILIIWPVFCAEYDEIERNPVFSRYLKTIFFTLFFINWFLPDNDPRKFSLMMIPLSILSGSRYKILTRRYSLKLNSFIIYLFRILLILSVFFFIFYISPQSIIKRLSNSEKILLLHLNFWKIAIIQIIISLMICIYVERMYSLKKLPVFKALLLLSTATMLLFWAVNAPYRAQNNEQRKWAAEIKRVIGDDFHGDIVIYETKEVPGDFYGVINYLGCKARRLQKGLSDIPKNESTIFLISSDIPVMPERIWTKKITFNVKKRDVFLWEGVSIKKIPPPK
ncbi:MAG TPA: glycosyltransferase family 39 protein [Victivallales bacterium]|nr:glycosyltransferase family 39 protein [Victivallales bacterium]HPO91245.1 glycosyltransferase family 39 protein [Victivallales bacterium]HRU00474.1 glycosyltransferase family 39 protein [Victivallales bacterium]